MAAFVFGRRSDYWVYRAEGFDATAQGEGDDDIIWRGGCRVSVCVYRSWIFVSTIGRSYSCDEDPNAVVSASSALLQSIW